MVSCVFVYEVDFFVVYFGNMKYENKRLVLELRLKIKVVGWECLIDF